MENKVTKVSVCAEIFKPPRTIATGKQWRLYRSL
jgi:hypothetical protein